MATAPVFLFGESNEQQSLAGHGVANSWTGPSQHAHKMFPLFKKWDHLTHGSVTCSLSLSITWRYFLCQYKACFCLACLHSGPLHWVGFINI